MTTTRPLRAARQRSSTAAVLAAVVSLASLVVAGSAAADVPGAPMLPVLPAGVVSPTKAYASAPGERPRRVAAPTGGAAPGTLPPAPRMGGDPSVARRLDATSDPTTPATVTPDGPTSGPSNFQVPFSTSACETTTGNDVELVAFYSNGASVVFSGYFSYGGHGAVVASPGQSGRVKFGCYDTGAPNTIVLGISYDDPSAIWRNEGFDISREGDAPRTALSSSRARAGEMLSSTTFAPKGPTPCPLVPTVDWQWVTFSGNPYFGLDDPEVRDATSLPVEAPESGHRGYVYEMNATCGRRSTNPDNSYPIAVIADPTDLSITAPTAGAVTRAETFGRRNRAQPHCGCVQGWAGDPVNTATGDFSETEADLRVDGPDHALDLERTYNSEDDGTGLFGPGWSSSYDLRIERPTTDGPVTVVQETGARVTFAAADDGTFTAPSKTTATLTKAQDGGWTFTTHEPGDPLRYAFDADGRLDSITDRHGIATTLTRPDADHLAVEDGYGHRATLTLDAGRATSLTGPAGLERTYRYSSAGELTEVVDALGGSRRYTYGPHGITDVEDELARHTSQTYDDQGRVVAQVAADGGKTTFAYGSTSPTDLMSFVTSPAGNVTRYEYDHGLLLTRTVAVGTDDEARWSYEYDPDTLGVASLVDPDGRRADYSYDEQGREVSRQVPGQGYRASTYDDAGDLLTTTESESGTTIYAYDADGDLTEVDAPTVDGGSAITRYAYGDGVLAGRVTSMTDPLGHTTHYELDPTTAQVTAVVDPLGRRTTRAYDAMGRLTTITSPSGAVQSRTYDRLGRLTSTTSPQTGATTYRYDAAGQMSSQRDANGGVTTWEYDALGRVIAQTHTGGATARDAYGPDGELTSSTDGAGRTTKYAYDHQDRLVGETDPAGRTSTRTYSPGGRLASTLDHAGGAPRYYNYDSQGLLTQIGVQGLPELVTRSYDSKGRLTSAAHDDVRTSYSLDPQGRVTSETDGAGDTISYEYDLAGHLTSIDMPGNHRVTRTYDAAGQLIAVRDWLGGTTTFAYDGDGQLVSTTRPNGVVERRTRAAGGVLTELSVRHSATGLADWQYAHTPAGQLTSVHEQTADGSAEHRFSYGANSELASEDGRDLAYDGVGDPSRFRGGAAQTFDDAEQLTSSDTPDPVPVVPPVTTTTNPVPTTTTSATTTTSVPTTASTGEQPPLTPGTTTTSDPTTPPPVAVLPGTLPTPPDPGVQPVTSDAGTRTTTPAAGAAAPASVRPVREVTRRGTGRTASVAVDRLVAGQVVLAVAGGDARRAPRFALTSTPKLAWSPVSRTSTRRTAVVTWQARVPAGARKMTARARAQRGGKVREVSLVTFASGTTLRAGSVARGRGAAHRALALPAGSTTYLLGAGDPTGGRPGRRTALAGTQVLWDARTSAGAVWLERTALSGSVSVGDRTTPVSRWAVGSVTASRPAPAPAAEARAAVTHARSFARASADRERSGRTTTAGTAGGPQRTFTSDAAGQRVTSRSKDGSSTAYIYDADGELTGTSHGVAYTYDALGLRASSQLGDTSTAFSWSTATQLPLLLGAGDRQFVYGPGGQPLEQIADGQATYLISDGQDDVRLLLDGEGVVTGRYDYDAWGEATHNGKATTPLQYNGQYTDAETGFQYLRSRYYDPSTGTYLTPDPLRAISGRRYAYANADPVDGSDPSGAFSVSDLIGNAWNDSGAYDFFDTHNIGVCAGVSATWKGYGGLSGCVGLDGGYDAVSYSATSGVGTGKSVGVSLGGSYSDHVDRESGGMWSATQGGSLSIGRYGAGLDVSKSAGDCGQVDVSYQPSVGLGIGVGGKKLSGEVHTGATYSYTKVFR